MHEWMEGNTKMNKTEYLNPDVLTGWSKHGDRYKDG